MLDCSPMQAHISTSLLINNTSSISSISFVHLNIHPDEFLDKKKLVKVES